MERIDYKEIGNRIRLARHIRNLTQEKAAELCEITASYYGNLERGDKIMSIETLIKISKGLCVSADYLLFGEEKDGGCAASAVIEQVQRSVDREQFEKYLEIIRAVSTVVPKL